MKYIRGWFDSIYRDHAILQHGGNTVGHSTEVWIDVTGTVGLFVSTNMDNANLALQLINWYFLDIWNGYAPWLNTSSVCQYPCQYIKCETWEQKNPLEGVEINEEWVMDVEAMSDYVGSYTDPLSGTLVVGLNPNNTLFVTYNTIEGTVNLNVGYDVFVGQFTIPYMIGVVQLPIQFFRNVQGVVSSIQIPLNGGAPNVFVTFTKAT
jgi:hypothetical protein